jgi:hypothetical protein
MVEGHMILRAFLELDRGRYRAEKRREDERKRCTKSIETKSKASIAIISGIYNANPKCIQQANDVQNPKRLGTPSYGCNRKVSCSPSSRCHYFTSAAAAEAEAYLHLPQCQHSSGLFQRPHSRNRIHLRWHLECHLESGAKLLASEGRCRKGVPLASIPTLVCHSSPMLVVLMYWAVMGV